MVTVTKPQHIWKECSQHSEQCDCSRLRYRITDKLCCCYCCCCCCRCKETGESKVILTTLCGHGHFDMAAYEKALAGDLQVGRGEEAR